MHRIGTDLFDFNGKQFLIMVDYYSSYPWVRRLRNISSASCIDAMKSVFSEFGYPQHIHSDSGRQYSSQEFNSFVYEFNVKHTMFNAECYVGTMKRIVTADLPEQLIRQSILFYLCSIHTLSRDVM